MAFCDSLLWNRLFQAATEALKGEEHKLGTEEERKAVASLLADDGLGETWKSLPLSASWSFWKDLTKPHNKVGMKTQDFAKHLQETGHFKTIAVRGKRQISIPALDDIWQARTKNLRMFSNLRIFRDPIKPLWEVPQNREGGKFVLILNKSEAEAKTSGPTPGAAPAACSSKSGASGPSHHSDSEEDDVSQTQSSKSGTNSEKPSVDVPIEYKLCLSLMVLGLLGPVDQFCGCVLSIRAFGHMISIWVSSSTDERLINDIRRNIASFVGVSLDSISFQRHNESIRNNTRNLSKTETRKRMREARAKGDLMEAPQQRPPRRKSESEKPIWSSHASEYLKRASTESSATTPVSLDPSVASSSAGPQPQHPKDMKRSLSGGRLNAQSSSSAPNAHQESHPTHHQQTHTQNNQKQPTSPRGHSSGGSRAAPATPSGASGTHTSHSVPNTPGDAQPTRVDPNFSEPSKSVKMASSKRSAPYVREKVHFQESVEIQTIYTQDAPGHSRGQVERGRMHPPAPLNIPNINILTGTPPSISPLHQAMAAQKVAMTSGKSNGEVYGTGSSHTLDMKMTTVVAPINVDNSEPDDGGWTVVGHKGTAIAAGRASVSSDPKIVGAQLNAPARKRRTQSASAAAGQKLDPNYVSPEALFGADLPLVSPADTPRDSMPSSPPTELDEDDMAFLEEQRRLRSEHNVQDRDISNRIHQLSLNPNPNQKTNSNDAHAPSSQNQQPICPRSQLHPTSPRHNPSSNASSSSAHRRSRNKRRKSTTDSETTPYNPPTSSATGGETSFQSASPGAQVTPISQN